MAFSSMIVTYECNPDRYRCDPQPGLKPVDGFLLLQSLLINFALGYPFSLLYAVAFTCILHVLWRAPRAQKALIGICSLVAALYFPFGQAYGSPNFNTLLALHSTNMEESTEILTIFPWYSYVVGLFIFALGVIAIRRQPGEKILGKIEILCLVFSVAVAFVAPIQNIPWDGKLRLTNIGYPVFRFVKDVVVNNKEVLDEQARMAELSNMKDTWNVLAVKPKYHTYVVVIGESAVAMQWAPLAATGITHRLPVRSKAPVYRLCRGQRLDAEIARPDP
jgi:glucan phosphoethanolaminetransferase (alkaline phosphatase superfamily)